MHGKYRGYGMRLACSCAHLAEAAQAGRFPARAGWSYRFIFIKFVFNYLVTKTRLRHSLARWQAAPLALLAAAVLKKKQQRIRRDARSEFDVTHVAGKRGSANNGGSAFVVNNGSPTAKDVILNLIRIQATGDDSDLYALCRGAGTRDGNH